jgi:hypothetical protein
VPDLVSVIIAGAVDAPVVVSLCSTVGRLNRFAKVVPYLAPAALNVILLNFRSGNPAMRSVMKSAEVPE